MAILNLASTIIAWWGASLSTILAVIKLFEVWRDRFRLEVSYNFTGDPTNGDEILIRNLSGRPVILTYWELFYRSGRWPHKTDEHIESAEHDSSDRNVDPHSTLTLYFGEESRFSWDQATQGRNIYIRLHIAGRRSQVRLVYPQ